MIIREIKQRDNMSLEGIIKAIFPEFGLPLVGTAYEDKETINMFESYQGEKEVFFVVEDNGVVVGGGGIKPLNGYENTICELQKVYFTPSARGKGYGKIIFNKCMATAKDFGYKQCYLESASQMKVAISIYEKAGFVHLEKSFGDTGHFSCGVWMLKDLV
jgi:putative acetyltransferase